MALREPEIQNIEPVVKVHFKDNEGKALLDSGESKSFVTNQFVNKVKLKTTEITPFAVIFANDQTKTIERKAKLNFNICDDKNHKYFADVFVIKNTSHDLILGVNF